MSLWRRAGTVRRFVVSRIRTRIAYEAGIFTLVANLDELRAAHRALKAEHGRVLRQVGIEHIAVMDQTIDLEAAQAEVERLTKANSDLQWESLLQVSASLEGEAS